MRIFRGRVTREVSAFPGPMAGGLAPINCTLDADT